MTERPAELPTRKDALKTLVWGVSWIIGAVCLITGAFETVRDFQLLVGATTAPGQIVDTWEELDECDSGEDCSFHGVAYRFRLPGGQWQEGGGHGSGRLRPELREINQPIPVEIEYLARDPSINRLKGAGSQSVLEWLFSLAFGGAMLVLFTWPGFQLVIVGVREYRVASRMGT